MVSEERDKIIKTFHEFSKLKLATGRLDVFGTCDRIRGACGRNRTRAYDLMAVYDTLRLLKFSGNEDILRAINDVYFSLDKRRKPYKNEISMRVLRHAVEANCDERTVYRRQKRADAIYQA